MVTRNRVPSREKTENRLGRSAFRPCISPPAGELPLFVHAFAVLFRLVCGKVYSETALLEEKPVPLPAAATRYSPMNAAANLRGASTVA